MEVRSKTEFYKLWEAGVLGNRTHLWRDPRDAYDSGAPLIGFREHRAGGGTWERVNREQVFETFERWKSCGRNFTMDDGAPDWAMMLQGEVCRTYRGLEGYLDTICHLPMRKAMAAGHMRHCTGATVLALIDKFMDPSSQDDLWDLLDLFPNATIEFTCFAIDVGNIPNRKTIFWETRNY